MRMATSILAAAALGILVAATAARAQECVGDCNGDGMVAINELIIGVNIALGAAPVSQCPSFDANGDGMVGINELITAVNNALTGCGPPVGCSGTERVFTIEPGVELGIPGDVSSEADGTSRTGLFTSALSSNAAASWPPGPVTLIMGTADANGVACLTIKEDVTLAINILDSTCLCFKMLKEGATGSIDCDGGTAYDTSATRVSMMPGFGWSAMTGEGSPSGPGNANLLVMGLFERVMMTCQEADCPNHQYTSPPNLFAFTTTTATSTQETTGAPIVYAVPGEPFSCTNFATPGSGGMLAAPAPTTIDPIGDVSNVFRMADSTMPPAP